MQRQDSTARCLPWALATVLSIGLASGARAERVVLAPAGLVAQPASVSVEYAGRVAGARNWLGWTQIGLPQADLGVELEAERSELDGRRGTSLSAQYSVTGNAFSDIVPALSVGVRDLLNDGREHRAIFLSMTKTVGLSQRQERAVRSLRLHLGAGTSRLDGPFAGISVRLALGPEMRAEYVRRSVNASASLPVTRYGELRAYTLDGRFFLGGRVGIGW